MNNRNKEVGTLEEDLQALGMDPKLGLEALEASLNLPEPGEYVPDASGKKRGEGSGIHEQVDAKLRDALAASVAGDEEYEDEEGDEVEEGVKIVKRKKRRGAKAVKQRRMARKSYKKSKSKIKAKRKKVRKTAKFKKRAKIRARIKAKKGPLGKGRALVITGMETVANLSEQIGNIVASVAGEDALYMAEHVEAMDLSALIADVLADRFEDFGDDESSDALNKLADTALNLAEKIEAGEMEEEDIEEKVKAVLSGVASAMEAYDNLEEEEEEEGTEDGEEEAGN